MSCSRDTDGDGNCGQPACPECGVGRRPVEMAAIAVSGSRFRILGQESKDGLHAWYDSTDPDIIDQVLRLERAETVIGGVTGGFSGNTVAAELRAAGLLEAAPLLVDEYVDELRRLKKEAGIVDL